MMLKKCKIIKYANFDRNSLFQYALKSLRERETLTIWTQMTSEAMRTLPQFQLMNENLISPILLLDQLHQLDIVLDLFAKHETVRVVEHESVQTVVFAQE